MSNFWWKYRIKRDVPSLQTLHDTRLENQRYNAHCLMMISNDVIIVYKDDTDEDEQKAEIAYLECVAKERVVRYENRKINIIKKYNRVTGEKIVSLPRVDFNILKETITQLQQKGIYNKRNSTYLKKIWFPFIFRLLDDGELGSQDKDMTGRGFLSYLKTEGFIPGGHSNFFEFITKLKPKSRFPHWELTGISYKKNIAIRIQEIILFAKDFVDTYHKLEDAKNRTKNRTTA